MDINIESFIKLKNKSSLGPVLMVIGERQNSTSVQKNYVNPALSQNQKDLILLLLMTIDL